MPEGLTVLKYKIELENQLDNYLTTLFFSEDISFPEYKDMMCEISEIMQKLRDINSLPIGCLGNKVKFYKTYERSKM